MMDTKELDTITTIHMSIIFRVPRVRRDEEYLLGYPISTLKDVDRARAIHNDECSMDDKWCSIGLNLPIKLINPKEGFARTIWNNLALFDYEVGTHFIDEVDELIEDTFYNEDDVLNLKRILEERGHDFSAYDEEDEANIDVLIQIGVFDEDYQPFEVNRHEQLLDQWYDELESQWYDELESQE